MKNKLIKTAEDVLRIQEETSVERLRSMLLKADVEIALQIFRRINDLLEERDPELLLSLAIRSFHQGEDADAWAFLKKAKLLAPLDQEALRVALFFSMALGNDNAEEICENLLFLYPDDSWATSLKGKLGGDGEFLNLPPLRTKWEMHIRGESDPPKK